MDVTQVIKTPVVSTKAYDTNGRLKKLVVEIAVQANKALVKEAFEKLHNAKVARVNILIKKGKEHRDRKGRVSVRPKRKVAIVTFKEGYEIDLTSQVGAEMAPIEASEAKVASKKATQKKEK